MREESPHYVLEIKFPAISLMPPVKWRSYSKKNWFFISTLKHFENKCFFEEPIGNRFLAEPKKVLLWHKTWRLSERKEEEMGIVELILNNSV